jgi:hypothetical protein
MDAVFNGNADVLTCPGPRRPPGRSHRVERWSTLDVARGVLYGGGDRYTCFLAKGEMDDILRGWHELVDGKRHRTTGLSFKKGGG